ncbi:unnamed protein product, partial [Effrenium voratum]
GVPCWPKKGCATLAFASMGLARLLFWTLAAGAEGLAEHLKPPGEAFHARFELQEILSVTKHGSGFRPEASETIFSRRLAAAGLPMWDLAHLAVTSLPDLLRGTLPLAMDFPEEMKNKYEDPEELGQGSFAVTFLAVDKVSRAKVAVKVLKVGSAWLTPSVYKSGPAEVKNFAESSRTECIDAMEIQTTAALYPEGSRHMVKCLEDGISARMKDPLTEDTMPFYLVLEYAGKKDLNKWWTQQSEVQDMAQNLRTIAEGMYKGLKFLADVEGMTTQWVHH